MRTVELVKLGVKSFSTSQGRLAAKNVHPGYAKIKEAQEHFQIPDGKPVHLKGGIMDVLLYRATMALCGYGLFMTGKFLFYDMQRPRT